MDNHNQHQRMLNVFFNDQHSAYDPFSYVLQADESTMAHEMLELKDPGSMPAKDKSSKLTHTSPAHREDFFLGGQNS